MCEKSFFAVKITIYVTSQTWSNDGYPTRSFQLWSAQIKQAAVSSKKKNAFFSKKEQESFYKHFGHAESSRNRRKNESPTPHSSPSPRIVWESGSLNLETYVCDNRKTYPNVMVVEKLSVTSFADEQNKEKRNKKSWVRENLGNREVRKKRKKKKRKKRQTKNFFPRSFFSFSK